LRPYGDIDLVVRREHYSAAANLFSGPDAKDCWVDLHSSISELADRSLEKLFDRSKQVQLREETVTVLSPEDHLALLAVHLLKHGAWRPLWLCDIGAAIESLPSEFDWDACLGKHQTRAGWINAAIALAGQLLGARLDGLPRELSKSTLPDWLVQSVLKQWNEPFAGRQPPMNHPLPMSSVWRQPALWLSALRQRWPDPILATVSVNGKFNSLPRLPYQLANCLTRTARFMTDSSRLTPQNRTVSDN
jgi:hypothetical protein